MSTPLVLPRVARDPAMSGSADLAAGTVVFAGLVILVTRPFVAASPEGRLWLFAASYVAIGLAALAVPAAAERTATSWAAMSGVLAFGLGAVGVAALVAGPPVPTPWGAGAVPLAVLAAVAEEALLRRAAYGRLSRFGAPVAVVGSAVLFAAVHLPAYGLTAFPVDLGAGLLLSWQRWASGTWTVPAATHVAANLVAVLR